MSHMAPHAGGAIPAKRHQRDDEPADLFPDMPEARKRKFILVEDNARGSRLRVRVTLQGVDTNEIPDSFRKSSSVYPHSFFPREMQSPPPSATGSRFFPDDRSDDGIQETEGSASGRPGARRVAADTVRHSVNDEAESVFAIDRITKTNRQKEVKLNDLGYRMAWLQSRVFAGRPVFMQRALDTYRNKTRKAVEDSLQEIQTVAPHFETRIGKRRWNEPSKRSDE